MKTLIPSLFAIAAFSVSASATVITTITDQLTAADPTQLGRVSRSGVPSDWSAAKSFPGVINAGTTYNYDTYAFNVGVGNYLQFLVDWGSGTNAFAVAYQTSYDPNSLSTNYLGDIGASGNSFGNPGFFQVIADPNSVVLLVISSAVSGAGGLNTPYTITTESYIDSAFTDVPASSEVPEPATISLLSLGFGGLALTARRRNSLR